jgi:hypothetical protein
MTRRCTSTIRDCVLAWHAVLTLLEQATQARQGREHIALRDARLDALAADYTDLKVRLRHLKRCEGRI